MAQEFNHFAELAEKLHIGIKKAIRDTAIELLVVAQGNAAVKSGFMRSAIYTITPDARFGRGFKSTYGQGLAGSGNLDPEMPPPPKDTMAYVVAGADYSIYVNYGTVHMPAQPFMEPSADQVRPNWEARLSGLESQMK